MPVQIDIAVEDKNWNDLGVDLEALSRKAIETASSILDKSEGELSLAFVSDTAIQVLNRDYRHKDKATNVLSFPMEGLLLGDIVFGKETIVQEAQLQGKKFEDHLSHLIVHGFLHLLGYDHVDETDAAKMESVEIVVLSQMGIDNPYEIKEP